MKAGIVGLMATYTPEKLHQISTAGVANKLELYDCLFYFC